MPTLKRSFVPMLALLAACSGVTDPVVERGLRVENTTSDSVAIAAISATPTTDFFISTLHDTTPRLVTDSAIAASVQVERGGVSPLIAPGSAGLLKATEIPDYDPSRELIVVVTRFRGGYLFHANSFVLAPAELRASGARIVLRPGRYFPTVVR